jgi:hypothetical protein
MVVTELKKYDTTDSIRAIFNTNNIAIIADFVIKQRILARYVKRGRD